MRSFERVAELKIAFFWFCNIRAIVSFNMSSESLCVTFLAIQLLPNMTTLYLLLFSTLLLLLIFLGCLSVATIPDFGYVKVRNAERNLQFVAKVSRAMLREIFHSCLEPLRSRDFEWWKTFTLLPEGNCFPTPLLHGVNFALKWVFPKDHNYHSKRTLLEYLFNQLACFKFLGYEAKR